MGPRKHQIGADHLPDRVDGRDRTSGNNYVQRRANSVAAEPAGPLIKAALLLDDRNWSVDAAHVDSWRQSVYEKDRRACMIPPLV